MSATSEGTVDVAVVGAGPVGLTLALLLERLGVSCAVLEARTSPHPLPRAVHLDDEALLALEAAGAADGLAVRPLDGMSLVDRDLRTLATLGRGQQPLGRPASVLMHQPALEAQLWRRARGVLRPGWRVERLAAAGEAVAVGCVGRPAVRARWVVGCDGASSGVRQLAGIGVEELGFCQRWLVVDLTVSSHSAHPPRVLQVCDPARPATSVPVGHGRHRFEFRAAAEEDEAALLAGAAGLAGRLAQRLGVGEGEVERAAVYEFRGRVARAVRRGRVLLAGDAAHEMPPFLGQGLCSGLRDAANLAWKLAYVVGGRATPALLDTYAAERLPHARRVVALTAAVGRAVAEDRAGPAAVRDRLLPAVSRALPVARLGTVRVPLPRGPLVEGGGRPWAWGLARRLGPAPGQFLVAGAGCAPDDGLPSRLRAWWQAAGAEFVTLECTRGPARITVVRPDAIVLGRYRAPRRGKESPLAPLAVRLSRAGLRAPA